MHLKLLLRRKDIKGRKMFLRSENLTTRNGMQSSIECRVRTSGNRNCLLKSITTHITGSIHQVQYSFQAVYFLEAGDKIR
jgi:hypothetical protein